MIFFNAELLIYKKAIYMLVSSRSLNGCLTTCKESR